MLIHSVVCAIFISRKKSGKAEFNWVKTKRLRFSSQVDEYREMICACKVLKRQDLCALVFK